jgi:hypothetical protein
VSDANDEQSWIEHPEIFRVGCGHLLRRFERRLRHARRRYLWCRRSQKPADARGVNPPKGDDIGGRLADKAARRT